MYIYIYMLTQIVHMNINVYHTIHMYIYTVYYRFTRIMIISSTMKHLALKECFGLPRKPGCPPHISFRRKPLSWSFGAMSPIVDGFEGEAITDMSLTNPSRYLVKSLVSSCYLQISPDVPLNTCSLTLLPHAAYPVRWVSAS